MRNALTSFVLVASLAAGLASAQGDAVRGFSVGLLPLTATGHLLYPDAIGSGGNTAAVRVHGGVATLPLFGSWLVWGSAGADLLVPLAAADVASPVRPYVGVGLAAWVGRPAEAFVALSASGLLGVAVRVAQVELFAEARGSAAYAFGGGFLVWPTAAVGVNLVP